MHRTENLSEEELIELYSTMLEIRMVEAAIGERYREDEMRTPIHLYDGQEAIAAGVCFNLGTDDYVFSNHRGHGHYIAKKGDLNAMIAELYNKETGCSRGRGGSMHLIDNSVGLPGSSAIVAGGIPLAVGAALSSKMKNNGRVAVAFFGDGASEEGVLYESMHFTALKKLPVIFVCENNQYSVCSPIKQRQYQDGIYKRAEGFSIPSFRNDGNDVLKVYEVSKQAIERARKLEGPTFLEFLTYRTKDHHDTKTGVEIGYRTKEEWDFWVGKCPVTNFEKYLFERKVLTNDKKIEIETMIKLKIEDAFSFAKASPLPKKDMLMDGLYQ